MSKYVLPAVLLVLSHIDLAAAEQISKCEARDQLVPTAKVAQEIYQVILNSRHEKVQAGDGIKVHDDGDYWSVFQYPKYIPPPKTNADGSVSVTVVAGGGSSELTINKCDGSMSHHYSR